MKATEEQLAEMAERARLELGDGLLGAVVIAVERDGEVRVAGSVDPAAEDRWAYDDAMAVAAQASWPAAKKRTPTDPQGM